MGIVMEAVTTTTAMGIVMELVTTTAAVEIVMEIVTRSPPLSDGVSEATAMPEKLPWQKGKLSKIWCLTSVCVSVAFSF